MRLFSLCFESTRKTGTTHLTVFYIFSSSRDISIQRCVKWHQKMPHLSSQLWPNFGESSQIFEANRFACQQENYKVSYNSLITCNDRMKLCRQQVPYKRQLSSFKTFCRQGNSVSPRPL